MTECFDCMDPANYAAVALKLQETALSAEECIFELERTLRQAANLPTLIRTSTATQSATANIQESIGQDLNTTITFANSSLTSFNTVPPAGVWLAGAFLNATATGVVNDNTYRQLQIAVRRPFQPPSQSNLYTCMETQFEPNVGNGVDMVACTTVVLNGVNQLIRFQFQHGNTSSTLNVGVGAIYWAHRLSDQVALKEV